MTEMHVTKVGDDRYHAVVDDTFTNVDEDVNDSQLLGMLDSKKLVDGTSGGILALLDSQHIGYEVTITYE
jgi:hypothetical protein